MALESIYAMRPINGTAAAVVAQSGCMDGSNVSRKELIEILNRLDRKQRLLSHILGIKTYRQRKNFLYRVNKLKAPERGKKNPRAAIEYVLNGRQIQNINQALAGIRSENKARGSKLKDVGNE